MRASAKRGGESNGAQRRRRAATGAKRAWQPRRWMTQDSADAHRRPPPHSTRAAPIFSVSWLCLPFRCEALISARHAPAMRAIEIERMHAAMLPAA